MHFHAYAKKTAWIYCIHLVLRHQVQLKEFTQFISGIPNKSLTQELPLPSAPANMPKGMNGWNWYLTIAEGHKLLFELDQNSFPTCHLTSTGLFFFKVSFKVFISVLSFVQINKPEMKDLKYLCHSATTSSCFLYRKKLGKVIYEALDSQ